ncbi:hypothetical protein MJO28_001411 [Puccinia striiformis f. sp. tritici]|uniref:Uncharacterized protein n=1 Tax=Puccinia striiformis f. sp. tritici TaxID=168172 RepID=A0ACC0ETW0_9BASI|nr:hypothetical protein Pst134EB_004389 [Puccinia striiformis f. sp. tritici]KAI7960922.1 hypothetical protein MJO28_001411 [Puccinia striiformis f. sp. tritici]KAI9620101.1 hypothetical protein KEM48_008303 [Puccinia striiformis f. sp. tritici PST-130]
MIATQLLAGVWFAAISIRLTASLEGPNCAIEVNQAEDATNRGLRALVVEEKPQQESRAIDPSLMGGLPPKAESNQRKIVRSQKGLATIQSWNSKQEQVVSLHKYATQLSEYQAEIQKQLTWIEENTRDVNEIITQALPRAKELFEESKKEITELKNWRLMLLGDVFDELQNDIYVSIGKILSRDLLQLVKEFITEHRHLFDYIALNFIPEHPKFHYEKDQRYRLYTLTPLDYSFQIIDFLLEHQFISPEDVRDIFQDKKLVEQVVNYTVRRYENDLGFYSWPYMLYLTEHWHWQSINKYFSVLRKREMDQIDLVFHLGNLRYSSDVNVIRSLYGSGKSNSGAASFIYEKYFSNSHPQNASNGLGPPGYGHGYIGHQMYPEIDGDEMNEIIDQLIPQTYDDEFKLQATYLVDIFSFMEEELCPGIVSQLCRSTRKKDCNFFDALKDLVTSSENNLNHEDVFQLASLYSSNEMIDHTAQQIIKTTFHHETSSAKLYVLENKQIYQDYIDQKQELLDRFKETYMGFYSVGKFDPHADPYKQGLPYDFVQEDLNKMWDILDNAVEYEEVPQNFKEEKQKPNFERARLLNQ